MRPIREVIRKHSAPARRKVGGFSTKLFGIFDPAIIGGPLFLPRNWADSVRDGSLFYLNSLEISYAFVERVSEKNFSSSLDQLNYVYN